MLWSEADLASHYDDATLLSLALLSVGVWMVLRGILVPRRVRDAMAHERDQWREVARIHEARLANHYAMALEGAVTQKPEPVEEPDHSHESVPVTLSLTGETVNHICQHCGIEMES